MCLLPCLPNVVHQVTQVMALFYMGPGVYTIFTRASVIFTALLALAFFPEERRVIRQWQFQAGTLLGLIGAFGVIWFQTSVDEGQSISRCLDYSSLLPPHFVGRFTAFLIKRPSAAAGLNSQFRVGQLDHFGAACFRLHSPLAKLARRFTRERTVNLILIISAVSCITLAHVLYYVAIREIGVALAQTLQLLCPGARTRDSPPGFTVNDSVMLSFGAPPFYSLARFLAMRVKPIATTATAENIERIVCVVGKRSACRVSK